MVEGGVRDELRALAREIGVSQTAHRHFRDKNALLAALAAEGFKRFFEMGRPSEEEPRADKAYSILLGLCKFAREHTDISSDVRPGPAASDNTPGFLRPAARRSIKCAGVERGLANGELRPLDNVASIAHTVWAAVHGVTTLMLDHADTYGYHRDLHLQAEKSMRMMIAGSARTRATSRHCLTSRRTTLQMAQKAFITLRAQ